MPLRDVERRRDRMNDKQCGLAMLLLIAAQGVALPVQAGEWEWKPAVTLQGVYSDNITLGQSQDKELLSVVNPRLAVSRKGAAGLTAYANYSAQGIAYFNSHRDDSRVNHTFLGRAKAEMVDDFFYLEGGVNYRQMVKRLMGAVSSDNLNPTGNYTDVLTMDVAPVINTRVADETTLTMRYDIRRATYPSGSLSDATSYGQIVRLVKADRGGQFYWNASYNNTRMDREVGADSKRESGVVNLGLPLNDQLWAIAQWGYFDNDSVTTRSALNGSYWSAGLRVKPSPRLSLSATTGPRITTASLKLDPSQKTDLSVEYTDTKVGMRPGQRWLVSGAYHTRGSKLQLSYTEMVTNTLRQLTEPSLANNNVNTSSSADLLNNAGLGLGAGADLPTTGELVNDEFFSRRLTLGYQLASARKSMVGVNIYQERRHYELADRRDAIRGVNSSLRWVIQARTALQLAVNRQQRIDDANRRDNILLANIALQRTISPMTSGSIEMRRLMRESALTRAEYTENRLMAQLNMAF